jgi:hypothetical protein
MVLSFHFHVKMASLTTSPIAIKTFGWIDYREIINDMAFPEMFKIGYNHLNNFL